MAAGRAARKGAIPGFYVATGPWLDQVGGGEGQLHKVGETGDLRQRLTDDCYTTAWPPGHWRYVYTFETATKADAARVEAGVLHAARAGRLGSRELIQLPRAELLALAEAVAAALRVAGVPRAGPSYVAPPVVRRTAAAGAERRAGEQLLAPADLEALAALAAEEELPRRLERLSLGAPAGVEGGGATPEGSGADLMCGALEDDGDSVPEAESADPALLLEAAYGPGGGSPRGSRCSGGTGTTGLRDYQAAALAGCERELAAAGRAVLKMACRCGKTLVAHGAAARALAGGARRILVLVPGLALLRQTAAKLDSYGGLGAQLLLVGSDPRPLAVCSEGTKRGAGFWAAERGAPVAATTCPALIAAACAAEGRLLAIATYHSSALLPDVFDLLIFDEAHRVCGDPRPRPFNHALFNFARGRRLYMTATPRYDGAVTMKDRALFGGEAYSYPLRRGIDAGHVNPFELVLLGGGEMVAQAAAAMDAAPKLLIFCRSIRHASELAAALQADGREALCAHSRMAPAALAAALARFTAPGFRGALLNVRLFQEGVEIPDLNGIMFAAPRHTPRDIIQSICRPLNRMPDKPVSKVFIPVSYTAEEPPESSDNVGKFCSILPVFDALIQEDPLLYEHVLDPAGSPYPLRWVDSAAQRHEGESAGIRYEPARYLAAVRLAVRRGSARANAGERLLRAAKIPWEIGFAELERIVRELHRYPKTTDCYSYGDAKVNFGAVYRHYRSEYLARERGDGCSLEPYQAHALESLPGWKPYGVSGPYPWDECLATLKTWLSENNGVPPKLEINTGGYVGLEATPLERLSGAMTCVNQSDGVDRKTATGEPNPGSGFTCSAEHAADLDALCATWGLTWRKARWPPPEGAPPGSAGSLVVDEKGRYSGPKTFIQAAHASFKAHHAKTGGSDPWLEEHFPGYPTKHRRQENSEAWARRKEIVPPRWRKRGGTAPVDQSPPGPI